MNNPRTIVVLGYDRETVIYILKVEKKLYDQLMREKLIYYAGDVNDREADAYNGLGITFSRIANFIQEDPRELPD